MQTHFQIWHHGAAILQRAALLAAFVGALQLGRVCLGQSEIIALPPTIPLDASSPVSGTQSQQGDNQKFELLPEPKTSTGNQFAAPSEMASPGQSLPTEFLNSADGWRQFGSSPDTLWRADATARAYYINDQRISFTGEEATFAVEGVLNGDVKYTSGDWLIRLHGQLFLTEPFDRNILEDSPLRKSFARNFDIDPLTISQLFLELNWNDLTFVAGKFDTPFGRYYYPIYRNNFDDSPFIRSDVILYRETGFLAQWHPEPWSLVAGITNGGTDQDANSSKALIARAGIDRPDSALGVSVKVQDGIGSEGQKQYNSYVGVDAMRRFGSVQLSGEAIADYYGTRDRDLNLDDIFWGRSIYERELNNGVQPLTGVGWYANLDWVFGPRVLTLNYGDYFPQQIGVPAQDTPIHRGIVKLTHNWPHGLQSYGVLLLENSRPSPFQGQRLPGFYCLFGLQLTI